MEVFELVIFDCDGVLVDSEIVVNRIYAEVSTEMGFPITTEEHIKKFVGHGTGSDFMKHELRNHPANYLEIAQARCSAAFQYELHAVPGIKEALQGLKLPRCVASNSSLKKIENMLAITGLSTEFGENIFSSNMVRRGKPAPDLFLFAAQKMKVHPKNCIVIEDSPIGTRGAIDAGMTVFGFTGGRHVLPGLEDALYAEGVSKVFSDMRALPSMVSISASSSSSSALTQKTLKRVLHPDIRLKVDSQISV